MTIVKHKFYEVYETTVSVDTDKLKVNENQKRSKGVHKAPDARASALVSATEIAESNFKGTGKIRTQTLCVRADYGPVTLTVNEGNP